MGINKTEPNSNLTKQIWEPGFYKTKAHLVAGLKIRSIFLRKKNVYFSNKKYLICYFYPERQKVWKET